MFLNWLNAHISIESLSWLFLAAFMIHDLEEIIWVEPWFKKNYIKVSGAIPRTVQSMLSSMGSITSSQFAVAVGIEFILFIPVTFLAAEHHQFLFLTSVNSIFFLHVFTHVGQSLYVKMFTPGVITAIFIVLPYSVYLFYRLLSEGLIDWNLIFLSIPVGLIIIPVVLFGHFIGRRLV